MTMFSTMLQRDRTRSGLSVGQAAWRFSFSPAVYREIEAGTRWPSFDTCDRICALFGWPQSFVGPSG
ncbi:MAG: helix-turn-helix transcriptional regulator [Actinomycetota bacterium]|nr:helix-turn-helix transcriptional regulator [Actinomycetota bacterium]